MGDFKYPSISCESFQADNKDVKFLDLVQDCFLYYMWIDQQEGEIF